MDIMLVFSKILVVERIYFYYFFCQKIKEERICRRRITIWNRFLDLNASNVWGTEAQELLELWQKDIKEEGFSSSEGKSAERHPAGL